MFEYPKIHEIRSASDMVHPASTPENPIIAAYVLVIRDRSPQGYIDDEFLDWNYILWWRLRWALHRELCHALRAEALVPDGEPQANDKFLEFSKDKLRFGYGKNHIRRSPDAPDLHEIGAAAEGFMAALFSTPLRSIAPKSRRCLPDQETSPVLLESGLRLYNLHRDREYISVSIGVPSAGGQQADRILGRVRFDEFEYSPEFGRLSEAAKIDGANLWQTTLNIILPLMRPVAVLSLFFSILGSLQAFAIIVALTDGGPSNSTNSAVSYLYNFGIKRMRVGFGSAIGVSLFVICVLVMVFYKRLFMRPKEGRSGYGEESFRSLCLLPMAGTAAGLRALFVAALGHSHRGL